MKTLTALTAAAALIAGISIASAASNNLTGASANGQFCAHIKATGSTDCRFATLAECEKATKPEAGTCVPNTNKSAAGNTMKKNSTTGSGSSYDLNATKSGADQSKMAPKNK